MKLRSLQHALTATAVAAALLPACSAAPGTSNDPTISEPTGTTAAELTTVTRSEALSRAREWVVAKVPYCQSANHQPDGDKACSPTCTRPDNPLWDPYRSDCSGFLSWSWGLPPPGRTTFELAPAVTDITRTIDPLSMLPGDAVNKPHDHTMLFVAWITPGKRATFMEEPGCSSSTPYAHQLDSDVTISGTSITVGANGITFNAIRYDAIIDDEAGAPPQDASTSHDAAPTPDAATAPDTGAGSGHDAGAGVDSAALTAPDAGSGNRDVPPGNGGNGLGGGTASNSGCSVAAAGQSGASGIAFLFAIALATSRRRKNPKPTLTRRTCSRRAPRRAPTRSRS